MTSQKITIMLSHVVTIVDRSITFDVAVVKDPRATAKGLGGHCLQPAHGMVFSFDRAEPRQFWMKDCVVPLDMLFVENGKIIQIEENVPNVPLSTPSSQIPQRACETPCSTVIELLGGTCHLVGIQVQDRVSFSRRHAIEWTK
jgi:uncharacterized membrane protein (UPF0127 family)